MRKKAVRRGFTLLELLIVLVIFGLVAVMGISEIGRSVRRAKLLTVANEVSHFANQLQTLSQSRNLMMFLQVGPRATDGTTPMLIISDDNSDGILDTDGTPPDDSMVRQYNIPADIVLAPNLAPTPADALYAGPKTQVASLLWSVNTDDVTVSRALKINFQGMTINQVLLETDTQISGPARLAFTHAHMAGTAPSLTPQIVYELRINPLWHATVLKGVWNGTKYVYSAF